MLAATTGFAVATPVVPIENEVAWETTMLPAIADASIEEELDRIVRSPGLLAFS